MKLTLFDKVFFVIGTECHTGNFETALSEVLDGEINPDTKSHGFNRLDLTVNGTRCIFQHHISATARAYLEASGLGIALGNEQLEAAKNGEVIPRVLVCAHRHRYGEFNDGVSMAMVTHPWQGLTRHGYKVVGSARTKPGGLILDFTDCEPGTIPQVLSRTYRPPSGTSISL